jgi:hypothetical protein
MRRGLARHPRAVDELNGGGEARRDLRLGCPGRKPPFLAVKRPARPQEPAIESRSLWRTLRPLNRPGPARTVVLDVDEVVADGPAADPLPLEEVRHVPLPRAETTVLDC